MRTDLWTEDAIATLKELWPTTANARMIGERLGFSKNAVIGKARRLKLQSKKKVEKEPYQVKKRSKVKYKKPVTTTVRPNPAYVQFNQLGPGMCKFPLSATPFEKPYGWCGNVCYGEYCKEHLKIMWPKK